MRARASCHGWWRCAWLVGVLLLLSAAGARAEDAIDLTRLEGPVSVTPLARTLLDTSETLDFEQVAASSFDDKRWATGSELTLGLTRAPLWLTVRADNRSARHKSWLLELAYPHLDHVTLYIRRANGEVQRFETGDMVPFAQRPIAKPDFLFPIENEPNESVQLYLRVATTGTLSLPLQAWSTAAYLEREGHKSAALWVFFGSLLMMALYNLAVYSLIRQGEYVTQALLLVAMCASIFTFNGLMFQHVLPNHPNLANKAIPFFLALALSACTLTCAQVASRVDGYERYRHGFHTASWLALACALLVLLLPKELGLRGTMVVAAVYIAGGGTALLSLSNSAHPQVRLYVLSWYFPLIGVPVTLLSNFGFLPPWRPLAWAAYMGCALQAVFTSLALAARVKVLGDHLAGLNDRLSSNVVSLEAALDSAKLANEAAQRAGRAKDEFLATMSHELRTPLNAIINVPQGLLESFVERRIATCSHCQTEFTLEAGDEVDADSECEECHARGTLVLGVGTDYVGDAANTARFLRKIERAGHHLLHMVDGVLDFSKMGAGRLTLHWAELDLCGLVNDVVDAMSEPARQKGLSFDVRLPSTPLIREADPVRLKQVLLNLLSNAIKFSDSEGAAIEIELRFEKEEESDYIVVRDQGIGIAKEHHERIFAGFEQVHSGSNRKYGGTGLGLPISRNLVRMHGGELKVESSLGRGASFVLRLPRQRPLDGSFPESDSTPLVDA